MAAPAFEITVDPSEVIQAARVAPVATYFWMRDFLGHSMVRHRVQWLRRKGIKFGRGGRGILVPRVNEGPEGEVPKRAVVYRVEPKEQRRADAPLDELRAEAFTGSEVLALHEFGGVVRAKHGLMAVPIATGRGGRGRLTPAQVRARGKRLVAFRSRRTGTLLLAERKRKRVGARQRYRRTKSGKLAKSQPKTKVDVLLPRWALIPQFRVRSDLEFYETWDALRAERAQKFSRNATRLIKDIARGVTT